MKFSKELRRKKIKLGIRRKIKGTTSVPRLTVYRSNKAIYCQLIDDLNGATIASASTRDGGVAGIGTKTDQAKKVGQMIAEKAKSASIEKVIFDRSGYLYHGRVKALAEGAREGGLAF
jgi:large subunit ribosomal protein L18